MSTTCLMCAASIEVSSSKDFPMCAACYKEAHSADMSTVRKLKFTEADHIIENVYLGGEGATIDKEYLKELNIGRVLTVAAHSDHLEQFESIEYKVLDIDDSPSAEEEENLLQAWPSAIQFMEQAKSDETKEKNVLVHCVSGISRSGATVIAYLMMRHSMEYQQALTFVRGKRPCVHPNSGFQRALKRLESDINTRTKAGGKRGREQKK